MGTIVARRRKQGGMAYMAKIVLTRDSKVVYRESRTFESHKRAVAWSKERETELAKPGVLELLSKPTATLADAIDRYTRESSRIGRTKEQVLDAILRHPIAAKPCHEITSTDLVEFARALLAERQPQTVGNYMSHLASVFAIAPAAWGFRLDRQAMSDALTVTRRLGVIRKSKERDRRPALEELDRLMSYFQERRKPSLPMDRITAFAIFSTRRQEEITRIRWTDLDEEHSRVLVRSMKHPGQKDGNDVWTDLPAQALAIIQAMPQREVEIFPFTTGAISAGFTRACQFLQIEDLHFHDLRHEGVSRLFEIGYGIPQAAAVSGHRSWQSLKRYTHLKHKGDKYAGWPWLERVTQPPQLCKPRPARDAAAPSR